MKILYLFVELFVPRLNDADLMFVYPNRLDMNQGLRSSKGQTVIEDQIISINNTFWTCLCCCTVCWTEIKMKSTNSFTDKVLQAFLLSFYKEHSLLPFWSLHCKPSFYAHEEQEDQLLSRRPKTYCLFGTDIFYQTLISAPESSSFDWMYSSKLTSSDKVMRLVWI